MTMIGSAAPRRHQYFMLPVADIIDETPSARSIVLEIPRSMRKDFEYRAGQFLTVRLRLGMEHFIRCYSISSSPATDPTIKITVKRVEGGRVSNWLNDTLRVGYRVEAMPPTGDFTLDESSARGIVALCSGSGITPVISIIKTALATSDRGARLFYANQSQDKVIFAAELNELAERYPGRLEIVHHIYDEDGYVDPDHVTEFIGGDADIDVYVCGSRRFTAAVQDALARTGLPPEAIRYELFSTDAAVDLKIGAAASDAAERIMEKSVTETVTIGIRGALHTIEYRKGDTLLETARRANLTPPFSCMAGGCAACMAHVQDGEVAMTFNNALSPEEVEAGWVLTCQGFPVSATVVLDYPA